MTTTQQRNVPELMLCPGCCTLDDILIHPSDPHTVAPQAGCLRCGFTFPILPAEFAGLTLEAMHRHDCHAAQECKNYEPVAQLFTNKIRELGLDQGKLLTRLRAQDAANFGNRATMTRNDTGYAH